MVECHHFGTNPCKKDKMLNNVSNKPARHVPVFISPNAETSDIGGGECDDVGDHRLVGPQVVLYVFGRALDIHRSLLRGLSALRWTDPLGNT